MIVFETYFVSDNYQLEIRNLNFNKYNEILTSPPDRSKNDPSYILNYAAAHHVVAIGVGVNKVTGTTTHLDNYDKKIFGLFIGFF